MAGSITTLGIGSGLDLQNIIDKLKAVDKLPIINKQAKQVEYKSQLAEFDTVNTKLLAVKTAAFNLSLNDTFDSKSISSSDTDVLTATVDSTATAGNYDLTVTALAKKNSWQTSGVEARDSAIATAAGDFSYTIDGEQTTISVTTGMTLEELMDAINDDTNNPGVTASIMDDGSGSTSAFHLVLLSDKTGEENAVTIDTNGTDLTFSEIQAAGTLNAQFTLNGMSYQRDSNSIDDAIAGVTLSLVGQGSSTFTVSSDTTTIGGKITTLVNAYNEAITEISTNAAYNEETGEGGLLSSLSSFTGIKAQLNNIFFGSIDGLSGEYDSMVDLGLSYNRDGTIAIDESTMNSALADHPDSVKEMFMGTSDGSVEGLADRLNDQLGFLTKYNGLIDSEKSRVQTTIDRLDDQIETAQERLDARYETMAKTFAELDKFMSSMESQGNALQQQMDSLNNMLYNK